MKKKVITQTQENTRIKLNQIGLKFTKEDYIKTFENGDLDAIKCFIDAGIDLNIKNKNGYTALILAAKHNNLEMAKLLISKGANLNVQSKLGWTALMYAAYARFIDMTKLLINSGADLHIESDDNITTLNCAADSGLGANWPDIIKKLNETN